MYQNYGATAATVRRVYEILEREQLIERRNKSGVYVAAPSRHKHHTVGFVLHSISESADSPAIREEQSGGFVLHRTDETQDYIAQFVRGIQEQGQELGLSIILLDSNRFIDSQSVDGVILLCNELEAALVAMSPTLPRVLALTPSASINISNVVADDFGGARLATEHLIELGHERISYIVSSDYDPFSVQRLAGYRFALRNASIPYDENLVRFVNKEVFDYLHEGEVVMKQWLEEGWSDLKSTAIIAHNDNMAFGIMKSLKEYEIRVPNEVSVVGFDDLKLSKCVSPALTTIHVPFHEIGKRCIDVLDQQICKGVHYVERIILPVELQVRESTAAVNAAVREE